ncbi:MAG: hypothetical protein KatS3mg105_2130 [Gemmatales bacterium]|nr:MAG: hypothetical protein KatS3mg105_2130 [Gemmatales bacterium]
MINRLADQGIDAIFMPNESSTNGMLNVLKSEGLAKKVILVGFDYSEPLRQALLDGEVHGLIVQDPYRMGYLGVWSLVHHLEGYDVTAQGKTVSTGEYLITKENVDKKSTLELFDPEYQAKRQIDVPKYPKKAD